MARRRAVGWLSRELMLRLMLPLLAIVVATGTFGAYTAYRLTNRVYDRWLLDAASSVAALIQIDRASASIDLPKSAETLLLYDDTDRILANGASANPTASPITKPEKCAR